MLSSRNNYSMIQLKVKILSSNLSLIHDYWSRFMAMYWNLYSDINVFFFSKKYKNFSLIKSPFVYKKTGRQFSKTTHKCAINHYLILDNTLSIRSIFLGKFMWAASKYYLFSQQLSKIKIYLYLKDWLF